MSGLLINRVTIRWFVTLYKHKEILTMNRNTNGSLPSVYFPLRLAFGLVPLLFGPSLPPPQVPPV